MKIKVDGKVYEYDRTRLLYSEFAFVQKKTGLKLLAWQAALDEWDAEALAGLVYILRRRAGEPVEWDGLEFDLASLEIVPDEDEVAEPAPKEDGAGAPPSGTSSS